MNGGVNMNHIENNEKYYIYTKTGKKIDVKNLHEKILLILDEIIRICKKNDIKFFLIAGSSLGVVNYEGFIPWDDDMDVAVSIDDWPKFIKAMKNDIGSNFYFDCYEYDKRFNTINGPWMKVRLKNTYIKEVNFLLKNRCKKGDGIFIDVIPYGHISNNKFIDELERTIVKINMLFIVLLDNLHINPIPFKSFVYWFSKKCMKCHKNSNLISQPVSVPWEKFLHEPVFNINDVYPLKKYNFENRVVYSYNNIEKVLKQWYGEKSIKSFKNGKWIENYPKEKRKCKHTYDLNLESDKHE